MWRLKLTPAELKDIVEDSFKPHGCVANKNYDYGYFSFQVTTTDGKQWTQGDRSYNPTAEKMRADDASKVLRCVEDLRKVLIKRDGDRPQNLDR